jgi:PAS domain S-box-containing protein
MSALSLGHRSANVIAASSASPSESMDDLLRGARVGTWEIDLADGRLRTSKAFLALLGFSATAARPVLPHWRDRIHPDDRDAVEKALKALCRKPSGEFEVGLRMQHADGTWRWLLLRGRASAMSAGVLDRLSGVAMDLYERRAAIEWQQRHVALELHNELERTEQALRESQEILATVSESSPVHLALFDLNRHCVFMNRPLPGSRVDQVLGMRFDDMLPLPLLPSAIDDFNKVIDTGCNVDVTHPIQFPGMESGYYRVQLRPVNRAGRLVGVVANIADVTELRREQEHQQLQANIIERMHEGVMLLDRDARILFTNPALDAMFGYAPGELTGAHVGLLGSRSTANIEDLRRMVLDEIDAGRSAVVSFFGRTRDGRAHYCQAVYSGARIGDSNCVIAVLTDVSGQRRLQRELLKIETRVQHRVGSDLHDGVGQQLAGIAMMLRALSQRADAPQLREELRNITEIVNTVLRTTRLMARGLMPVRAGSDGLLEGFEELSRQVFERFGVRVSLDIDLPPLMVLDENVASNLYRIAQEGMLNAARHAQAQHIEVSLSVTGRLVELTINDDGRGFDPLSVRGGGMGLLVMRFRAQMIGGYLFVESEPGRGTRLRCRCPVRLDAAGVETQVS